MKIKNHYVPQVYLKNWMDKDSKIWKYSTLVSNENVPDWKRVSPRSIGYYRHLYTEINSGHESDEVEKWLDKEFESPAKEPINKAIEGRRMSSKDWKLLIKFFAAQDVRTPKRYVEYRKRMDKTMPRVIKNTVEEVVESLESGERLKGNDNDELEKLPIKLKFEGKADTRGLKVETFTGRKTWLQSIKYLLPKRYDVLLNHKWNILRPYGNQSFFTSDHPTVRLQYFGQGKFDFNGGWNSKGCELIMPLNSDTLLYTKVGEKSRKREQYLGYDQTIEIRKILAQNAFRYIFSDSCDQEITRLRTRIVDTELYKSEEKRWKLWHEQQSNIENEFSDNS